VPLSNFQFSQLQCKQHVGQLGLTIGALVLVTVGGAEIVEFDPLFWSARIRGATRHYDDSALVGHVEASKQAIHKDEMTEVVDHKMLLDAVDEFALTTTAEVAGIAHQNIRRHVQGANCVGTFDHRIKVGQLKRQWRCNADDAIASRLCLLERSARANDVGTA